MGNYLGWKSMALIVVPGKALGLFLASLFYPKVDNHFYMARRDQLVSSWVGWGQVHILHKQKSTPTHTVVPPIPTNLIKNDSAFEMNL